MAAETEAPAEMTLTALPEVIVLAICSSLTAADLCSMQQVLIVMSEPGTAWKVEIEPCLRLQVCKSLLETASSPLLWRHRLAEDYDVRYDVRGEMSLWR